MRASGRLEGWSAPAVGGVALAAMAVVAATTRLSGLDQSPTAESFVLVFAAIVVEALPFVLLGALVAALIEVYVPDRAFTALRRVPLRWQMPAAVVGGMALPVCECGSVPVARRLMLRGVEPPAALTFMLAAPVVNPVVVLSTAVAFQDRGALAMVLGRVGLAVVVALLVAWTTGGERVRSAVRAGAAAGGGSPPHAHPVPGERRRALAEHVTTDFLFMGAFVVVGAGLAAALQTAVPQSAVSGFVLTPLVASALMMTLAFVLSLCSEADAFVALSFAQFPPASLLSFLVLGPLLDLKLALLYGATFGWGFVARVAIVAVPVVLAGSVWIGALAF